MTTTEPAPLARETAAMIEELFCQGHPLEHVVSSGQDIGWSRADVMTVLRDRQWDLDASGRLPRSKRVTVPRGLRSCPAPVPAPKPAAAPPRPQGRFTEPVEPIVVEGPSIDDWEPAEGDVEPSQPPAEVYEAIAEWADGDRDIPADVDAPPPAPEPQPVPLRAVAPPVDASAPAATTRRPVNILPPDTDAAVARFLAERTVPAPDEQFLTSGELRDAYEAWRGDAGAPAATVRQFGSAVTARYRKKQSPVRIDGVKPMCYHGIAWKPEESAATAPDVTTSTLGLHLLEEARASAALDGETQVLGHVYTAAAPRPVNPSAEMPSSDGSADYVAQPPSESIQEPIASPSSSASKDLLGVGRDHPDRRVRAAARAVEQAVDALCAALKRVS